MPLRIVVYSEGSGETAGEVTLPSAPGAPLQSDELGPAHFLIERTLERVRRIPAQAIQFEGPLRYRGRVARGGMLKDKQVLRRLLTWPDSTRRPDLAVILADEDGDVRLRQDIEDQLADLPMSRVLGVVRQEFESWLIADQATLKGVFGVTLNVPQSPEELSPGEAKKLLNEWSGKYGGKRDRKSLRIEIANACDLEFLGKRCPSFARLSADFLRDTP